MSKQDIEKRLGFAAQGVKAEMAIGSYKQGDRTVTVNGKKYEVLPYQMDFFIKELATLDTPEWRADVVKEYLRRGYIKTTAARTSAKAKFGRFSTEFGFLANQIKNQPDLAKKNIIVLAKKMGKEVDITRAEFEQLMQYAAKLGMETQVANAHDDVRPGFSRSSAKAKA
jgi:integrase